MTFKDLKKRVTIESAQRQFRKHRASLQIFEPGFHKSEILKSLKEILLNYTAKKQQRQEGERVGDLNWLLKI